MLSTDCHSINVSAALFAWHRYVGAVALIISLSLRVVVIMSLIRWLFLSSGTTVDKFRTALEATLKSTLSHGIMFALADALKDFPNDEGAAEILRIVMSYYLSMWSLFPLSSSVSLNQS